jgi:uncharacterized protein
MSRSVPDLSKKLIEQLEKDSNSDRQGYFANLFRCQLISKQYKDALASIDSVALKFQETDTIAAKTYAFPFRIFSEVMNTSNEGKFTDSSFDHHFLNAYNKLFRKAAEAAENYYKADLKSRQQRLLDIMERNRQTTKDSISYRDALNLCFSYTNYVVYTAELSRARALLQAIMEAKYIVEDSVMIAMRDGSQVSATIVRARNINVPQPVVFKFGIYVAESMVLDTRFIADYGYTAVIADTRGKRLSKQEIVPFEYDASDAYDIIDWISKQSWCNGKIGMYGGSYLGFTQWAAAKNLHPSLRTIVPQAAVGVGVDIPWINGVYWAGMLNWIHLVSNNKLTDWSRSGNKRSWESVQKEWYTKGLAFQALDSIEGRPNKLFQRYLDHPTNDKYWQSQVPYKQEFSRINIPILTITGYYDDDQLGAMYYFNQHHLYNKNPDHYLVIGPYDHDGAQGYPLEPPPVLKGYKIDSVAQISIMDLIFQWFDYTLKGASKPDLLQDKINFEVMGANRWRHVPNLKSMNNDTLIFYLNDSIAGNFHKLLNKSVSSSLPVKQEVNLTDRSNIDAQEPIINGDGPILDSSLFQNNHLAFVSDPLTKNYDINGSFLASLEAIVNKKDMDVVIKLYEQLPDGRYFQLSSNVARCSYLKNPEKRQLLTPGKPVNISLHNTYFTSRHLQKGSRIVLILGINKSPDWQINYGTGNDVSQETINDAGVPINVSWLTNSSYIKLPVWLSDLQ